MSWSVKCHEVSKVFKCQTSPNGKCHQMSNVIKCQISSNFECQFPGRCGRFISIFLQLATKILHLVRQLSDCVVYDQDGGPPAWQWPGQGIWRGGEQPGRRSPGGWRSCGGRGPISSTTRFWFQAFWHLVRREGLLTRCQGHCVFSWNANQDVLLLNSNMSFFTFTFWSFHLSVFM